MKRLLALLLVVAMLFSLAACSKSNSDDKDDKEKSSSKKDKDDKDDKVEKPDLTFQNQTVVDDENCLIEITDIDDRDGTELTIAVKNKSTKNYDIQLTQALVNGVDFSSYAWWYRTVEAGQDCEETVYLNPQWESDIGPYSNIQLTFSVSYYDQETWENTIISESTIHVYPYGEDKATTFSREPQDTDIPVVDNDYVTITMLRQSADTYAYNAYLLVYNKSDEKLMLSSDGIAVSGYSTDSSIYESIHPGAWLFTQINVGIEALHYQNLTEVNSLGFTLYTQAYSDTYNHESLSTDKVDLQLESIEMGGHIAQYYEDNKDYMKDVQSIAFDPVTVIDDNNCTVKLVSLERNEFGNWSIKTYWENKTTDTYLSYGVEDCRLNTLYVETSYPSNLAPGSKTYDSIDLSISDVAMEELGKITDIFVKVFVYDSNNYYYDEALSSGEVHAYPYGEGKATVYERTPKTTDKVLLDNEYVSITLIDSGLNDWGEYVMSVYVRNKTGDSIEMNISNMVFNGVETSYYDYPYLQPNVHTFMNIVIHGVEIPENFKNPSDLSFILGGYKDDAWSGEMLFSQEITVF